MSMTRQAIIFMHGHPAGILTELIYKKSYSFTYDENYRGEAISLTMPVRQEPYIFDEFPPFFDGLLPEGTQLEGLLRLKKIDRDDLFSQLITVGEDLVGAVTIEKAQS